MIRVVVLLIVGLLLQICFILLKVVLHKLWKTRLFENKRNSKNPYVITISGEGVRVSIPRRLRKDNRHRIPHWPIIFVFSLVEVDRSLGSYLCLLSIHVCERLALRLGFTKLINCPFAAAEVPLGA